jgi:uncharacterized protein (DUF433 family)
MRAEHAPDPALSGGLSGRGRNYDQPMAGVSILERPLYSITEAAQLLGLPAQTLKRWLLGFSHEGRTYKPVIRPRPVDPPDVVRWAEFVEAGFLREYRTRGVSLQHLRPMIERMREVFRVPYPLAHFKPLVDEASKQLVLTLQNEVGLEESEYLVVRLENWQLQWADPVQDFLKKVQFDAAGIARTIHPLGPESPVEINPELSFGVPQIGGIRTEVIGEALASGETVDEIAKSWRLRRREVQAALSWEDTLAERRLRAA